MKTLMNAHVRWRSAWGRLSAGLLLTVAALTSQAQSPNRSVRQVPPLPAPPAFAPIAPAAALPAPAGLPSPLPSPGGLPSQFPAGLPSPLPHPAGLPSVTAPNLALPGAPVSSPVGNPGPDTSPGQILLPPPRPVISRPVVVVVTPQSTAAAGSYTALQLAQAFRAADPNLDGELTREEAQHLPIMPMSFSAMDKNRDGVVSRWEYEDSAR